MSALWRRRLLFLALAATLGAAFWVSRQEEVVPVAGRSAVMRAPAFPSAERTGSATLPDQPLLVLPERSVATAAVTDPFSGPPTPAAVTARPAKAEAPPLPFAFIGRYVERGVTHVFLEQGEQLHTVKVGDIIDGQYRVEGIDSAVRLIHLPTQEKQLLEIGDL